MLVQLSSDYPHSSETLGPQVINDGPQVRRASPHVTRQHRRPKGSR
jgi:hypothetical protein